MRSKRIGTALLALGSSSACVFATPGDLAGSLCRIYAFGAAGESEWWDVPVAEGVWAGSRISYSSSAPFAFYSDGGTYLGSLTWISMNLDLTDTGDFEMSFGFVAGSAPVSVVAYSPRYEFRTVPAGAARARASASVTVTDRDNNFARATGLGSAGNGIFRACYNGAYPNCATFSHLVGFVFCGAGGTNTGSQLDPPFGYRAVGSGVRDMSVRIAFQVTANDYVSVATRMDVAEPGAAAYCDGDIDADRDRDLSDLSRLLVAFGSVRGDDSYTFDADFDADGQVGLSDLSVAIGVFGTLCP
jgi:hypothetical protein